MIVEGTCIILVVPEVCQKTGTLKCFITPSLEEEEVLLGCMDMVKWGILKKDFHIMQDGVQGEEEKSAGVKRCASNPNPIGAIKEELAFHSNHLADDPLGQGVNNEAQSKEKYLDDMRNRLLE